MPVPVPQQLPSSNQTTQPLKKPSNDPYYPQEVNPRSYNQPREQINQTNLDSNQYDSYREYPTSQHGQRVPASGMQSSHNDQQMSDRYTHNAPPSNAEYGREYGRETQNVSERLPSNVPSTGQIFSNLEKGERVLGQRKHDTTNVCGDRVIDDMTQVMKDTMNLVKEKNLGDSTRNIIDHSKTATSNVDTSNLNTQGLLDKRAVTQDVSDVASQLRRVTQLMVTSPAFRGFMWEFYQLSRDTFGPQMDQAVEKKLGVQEQADCGFDTSPNYGQNLGVHGQRDRGFDYDKKLGAHEQRDRGFDESPNNGQKQGVHEQRDFGFDASPNYGQKQRVHEQRDRGFDAPHMYDQQAHAPPLPSRHAPARPEDEKSRMLHKESSAYPHSNINSDASSNYGQKLGHEQRDRGFDASPYYDQKLGVHEQRDRGFDAPQMYDQQAHAPPLPSRHAPARPDDEMSRMLHKESSVYPYSNINSDTRALGQLQQGGNLAGFAQPTSESRFGHGATSATQFDESPTRVEPSTTGVMGDRRYREQHPHAVHRISGQEHLQGKHHAVPQPADDIRHAKNQMLNTKNRIPSEKREQLVRRWRAMFDEIHQDSRIQNAIRDMRQTLMYMRDKYQPVVQQHKEKVLDTAITNTERVQDDNDINVVLNESKGLLERFAGGKSLDPLINTVNEWYAAIRGDEQLRVWLEEFYDYLDTTVHTPEALKGDRHIDELDRFILRGQDIFQGRHRDLSRRLLDESNEFLYSLINDQATSRLRASVQNVIKDLFIDSEGRIVLKPDVYFQLRKAFMPIISEQLSNIEVSHVEEHNEQIDFALSNIVIDARDLKPEQFEVRNIAEIAVGRESKEGAALNMEFRISAKGTTCTVRDVDFSYQKHTFPKLKDSGILDASLQGNGLSFDLDVDFFADATGLEDVGRRDDAIAVRNHRHDRDHAIFQVKNCRVDIDKLKLDFRDANHEMLYKVFKPIIVSKATKEISRAIEDQLRHFINELNKAAIQARDQTMTTLDKTGANDRILRGTKPEDLNVGHSHKDRESEHLGGSYKDRHPEHFDGSYKERQPEHFDGSHRDRRSEHFAGMHKDRPSAQLEGSYNDRQSEHDRSYKDRRPQHFDGLYKERQPEHFDGSYKETQPEHFDGSHKDRRSDVFAGMHNDRPSAQHDGSYKDRQSEQFDGSYKDRQSERFDGSHKDWQPEHFDGSIRGSDGNFGQRDDDNGHRKATGGFQY